MAFVEEEALEGVWLGVGVILVNELGKFLRATHAELRVHKAENRLEECLIEDCRRDGLGCRRPGDSLNVSGARVCGAQGVNRGQ